MWPSLEVATRTVDIATIVLIGSLAVGIAATIVILWMGNVKESHWQHERTLSQQRIAHSQERIAQLGSETEKAKAQAKAQTEAAKANHEVAKFKAPRTLSPEQQERIVAKVRPFAGKQFDAALAVGDKEAEALLNLMETVLTTAGWVEIAWKGSPIVLNRSGRPPAGDISLIGVHIHMHSDQVSELEGAVVALASALKAEGIDVKVDGSLGIPNNNPNAVHVLIGKNP